MGQDQRSHWSRSNKGSKQRQVDSHQPHGASFVLYSGSGEDLDGEISGQPPIKTPPKSPMRQTSRTRARQRTTSTSSAPQGPLVRAGARTIYTAGRPPWYDSHGQLKEAFVIGE